MPTIPLRVIVLVIVVVVAAVSAIIVYFPNAKATSDAVDTLVADLRQETSNNLVALTRAQFSPVLTLAQTVIAYANLGSLNTTDGTHLKSWIPTLCALANTSAYFVRAALPNKDYVGCFAGVAYYRDPTTSNFYSGVAPPPLYPVPPVSQMTLASANFNTLAKPWYVPLKDVNAWSPFFVRTIPPAAASIAVGGPMYDSKGNKVGIISVNLDSINFLAAMLTVRVGLTGRAMVYEGTTGYYVAGNFNQSATVVTNVTTGALRLTWLNETTDDLIVASMGALGGQNGLLQLPPTFEASFGMGTDTVYVDITPIQDAWGLNLRLITAIRRSDFTSDLEAQEKTVIGAVVGAVAGLAVLCGILIWLLIAPLSTLASEMNVRDTMAIDGAAAGGGARSRSALSEVAEIQDAYWALQQELQRVKSYLPQSVLRQLERRASGEEPDDVDGGDGKNDVARSHGSQRSSALRSRSATTTPSEKMLRSGVSSSHNSKGDAAGTVMASMEAMLAVAKRPVSIVALNIRRFHQDILPKGETRVADFSSSFVTLIHEVSAAHRGVTHLMHGDRVFLSFNAASRVATHTTRAIQTAIAIRDRAMTQLGVTVTAGVASGEAVVGMLGNTAQRQFTVLGRVFSRAIVLERLCGHRAFLVNRAGDAPIDGVLAESSVVNAAGDTVAMRVVDVVALPQARRLQCIYTTVPPQTEQPDGGQTPPANVPAEGEWMYELDRARLQNPYVSYNEALECVAQGKHDAARAIFSEMQCPSTAVKSLRDLAVDRIVQLQSGSVESVASELGPYYLLTSGHAVIL